MISRLLLVSAVAVLMTPYAGAFAATDDVAPGGVDTDNPYLPQIEKVTKDLGARLDQDALKHLYYVREGFGSTRAVMLVRRDVEAAVHACAKANPDMKDAINQEFLQWTNEVDPIVKQNNSMIDQAIEEQTYAKPKEIHNYLTLISQAGEYANKKIDKQIVTTPQACESLKDSMDRTRATISKLLSEMKLLVWPLSGSDSAARDQKN